MLNDPIGARVTVRNRQSNGFEPIEHIQLGHAKTCHAVERDGAFQGRHIKPATTACPPRYRAKFMPPFGQTLAGLVEQFGRERPGADASGVSLGDSENVRQGLWANTSASRRSSGNTVGARHEGIGSMIDIEQGPLRTFKQ